MGLRALHVRTDYEPTVHFVVIDGDGDAERVVGSYSLRLPTRTEGDLAASPPPLDELRDTVLAQYHAQQAASIPAPEPDAATDSE